MKEAIQISTSPPEMKSQHFGLLREEGMKILREVASETWTDHNLHDPGVTLLEAISYALTEMGLRTGMDMRDLVASDAFGRKQEYYTAAEILPVSPITLRDLRKILIDHPLVQNAWVFALDTLPRGRLSILLEFANPELNSNTFSIAVTPVALGNDYNVDLAFPYWDDEDALVFNEELIITSVVSEGTPGNEWHLIEGSLSYFTRIAVFTPSLPGATQVLWVVAQVTTSMNNPLVELPLILQEVTNVLTSLVDNSPADPALIRKFNRRTRDAYNTMREVRRFFKDYRNLGEDLAEFKAVRLQEVGVSAIIEVNSGVNIEVLLSEIFFNIDRFIAPVSYFENLEKLAADFTTDKIFEGPSMDSGFLRDETLSTTNLTEVFYTSDILRLILQQRDQSGTDVIQREDVNTRNIAAVRNVTLANFLDNRPITSKARDCLRLVKSQRHIPQLSLTKSNITFYRNKVEMAYDLNRVIELFEKKKADLLLLQTASFSDIPLPVGEKYPVNDYYPIQNDLPLIYGVGEAGLPETATEERRALALQLKGYLFFFEQLTSGLASQLANINSFFSADPELDKTLFLQPLYHLPLVEKLFLGFNTASGNWENFKKDEHNSYIAALKQSAESVEQFLTRRNRVLNHLLAVFGEDMYDAATLAYQRASVVSGGASLSLGDLVARQTAQRNIASQQLIRAKSAFFYDLPSLNRDRAQGYGNPLWRNNNLLSIQAVATGFAWSLQNENGIVLLRNVSVAATETEARRLATETISLATVTTHYFTRLEAGGQLRLVIRRTAAATLEIAESPNTFNNPPLANLGISNMFQTAIRLWQRFALTTLETRMYHMLGIAMKERRIMTHLVTDFFEVFDNPPPIRKRFRMWQLPGFGGSELLTGDLDYTAATDPLATEAANTGIQTAISLGPYVENFDIRNTAPNVFQVVLLLPDGTVLAHAPINFATRVLAKAELTRIWLHIFHLFSVQGFYMVEHLFLSPVQLTDAQLTQVNLEDPYSFQISFIFPSGYARNFAVAGSPRQPAQPEGYRDLEFRKYAEQQIRRACPAHILPRVMWVDRVLPLSPVSSVDPSFDNFEFSYREWLAAYVADEIIEAFIGPLRNQLVTVLNNIYAELEI